MHAAVYARLMYFRIPIHASTSLFPKIILMKHTYVMSRRKLHLLNKINDGDDDEAYEM